MIQTHSLALIAAAILALSACAAPSFDVTAVPTVPARAVVVVSGLDARPTRAAPSTPVPSPTTDLSVRLVTVAPFLTRTPVQISPSPTLLPAYTSTRRPNPTLMSGSGQSVLTRPTNTRPPTRTPAPMGTYVGPQPDVELKFTTPTPEETIVPRIDVPGNAVDLSPSPWEDLIETPDDVHIYRIDAPDPDATIVVSLSGNRPIQYKVDVIAPRRGKVGRQRIDGTTTLRAIAEVGSDTGTYLVYVRPLGKDLPKGSYFISAETSFSPTPR